MRLQSLLLAVTVLAASAALGGTLTPGLIAAFENIDEQTRLPVLIGLRQQVELATIRSQLQFSFPNLEAEQHAKLVEALKTASERSMAEVKSSVEILERNGMADAVEYLWIVNMIKANVSRAGAELIANFEAVGEVGLDETIELMQPVETSASDSKMLNSEPALHAMRAPEAWVAGVTGLGTVVGIIGTPFSPQHAAFADRAIDQKTYLQSEYCGDATAVMLGAAIGCDKQKGDTIGVAPDATWRMLPLVCGQTHTLSDVLNLLQESQSGEFKIVPDVIVQSWHIGDSCSSGAPEVAWKSFANVEQLGSVLIWAAGDNGLAGRGSVALPAARFESDQTFFSVGAIKADGRTIDPESSRGPSPCNRRSIKPELCAIGETRSANADGFLNVRGTICAAGYVAGTVALMRQVNPSLSSSAAKIALQLSSSDLGVTGEDNDFGFGLLDVNAAVEMAASSSETGTVSGVVKYGGEKISGARAYLVGNSGSYTATSNADGFFRFLQIPAEKTFALYIARFGFVDFAAPDSVSTSKHRDFSVGVDLERGIADDVEVDRGFIMGVDDDNATAGVWTRAVPVASMENGQQVQVSEDATAYGSFCFVTGNGGTADEPAAANDVDGGKTTLRSPVFRLDNLADAKLKFKYAYSNDRGPQKGGDFFRVQLSNDAGETWTNLIQTSVSSNGWQEATFQIEDFVTPTEHMVLQFVAEDNAPPSLVEAAVDDIFIQGRPEAPEPPKNLSLTPAENGVKLTWNASEGASSYKLYLSNQAGHVFAPENFFITSKDTFLFVPYDQIPYEQFYFQVTAVK